ncbi:helix-turn-helix domain-containing protein [Chlamydia abortus]|uniref:helix-turn-helix domain-containing protein n=1 Tax=Chlamydia abortus TaxID=83555 RepID=UPI000A27BBD2|nr:helix-turn-helix transcriptional regulator [Chlamydia abortus]SGW53079.1 transcriptional regulator, y4mF family [Chlamydia abortus]
MGLISEIIKKDIEQRPELQKVYEKQDEVLEMAMRVVNLRDELNLTQRELADRLNVSLSLIQEIENGNTEI